MLEPRGARGAGLAFLAALLLGTTSAHAQSVWSNSAAGDWNTGANWSPAGVPDATATVIIDNGGEAQITTPGAAAASVILGSADNTTSGTLTITAAGTLTTSSADSTIGDLGTGAVTVSRVGSNWTTAGSVFVGQQAGSAGTLTIDMSASVDVGGVLQIAGEAGSNGAVSVDGEDTRLSVASALIVASSGTGALSVASAAAVDAASLTAGAGVAGNGSILVTGLDSRLAVSGAATIGQAGTGTMRVEASGTVSSVTAILGGAESGIGTATITGGGSSWINTGALVVGAAGTGGLVVELGGGVSTMDATLGSLDGGSGTLRVTGATSSLAAGGTLTLGSAGTGRLTVESGGDVISAVAVMGEAASGIGWAVVTGDGSSWTNDGLLVIGEAGSATLTVEAAGLASTDSATLGNAAGSSGNVQVTGANSALAVATALVVGGGGTGGIDINSAGTVTGGDATLGRDEGGSGAISLSGMGSSLALSGTLVVGEAGDGALSMVLGAEASANTAAIGGSDGGTGSIALTDDGSALAVADSLTVGDAGNGTLSIFNGANVTAADVLIGAADTGAGNVIVSNSGSALAVDGTLAVGVGGSGTLAIDAGALASAEGAVIGVLAGSNGAVTVNAAGSSLDIGGELIVGGRGSGTLAITGAGAVASADAIIGSAQAGSGLVTVDGLGSLWTIEGDLTVGESGQGALTISGLGAVTIDDGVGLLTLAEEAGSTGTLTIGDGGGSLAAAEVTGGAGTASVVFAHDVNGYVFTPDITGTASVVQSGSGRTILTGANVYDGATSVEAGTLAAGAAGAFSPYSGITVATGAVLDLSGYSQDVASLANTGTVSLAGSVPGTILSVSGDYRGGGGIRLAAVLGGNSSPADRLVIGGDVSGTSRLSMINLGGMGAATSGDGIRIVSVAGTSPSDGFTLGRTVAGAYDYRLYQGGIGTQAGDGNWYLRSDLSMAAQTYRAYPATLLAYSAASVGTLVQRTGGWTVGAATTTVPGGAFVRGTGLSANADPDTGSPYAQDIAFGQTGIAADLPLDVPGMVTAGFTATFGRSQVRVDATSHGSGGSGQIDSDAHGFGATLTYWGRDGLYADAVGQITYFDTNLSASDAGTLASGNAAYGTALSLEVGKAFRPAPSWSIVPQAQLVYASVSFDGFTDADATSVAGASGESLLGRTGLRIERSGFVDAITLDAMRYNAYVIANLYYGFLGDTDVTVGGTALAQQTGDVAGEFGLGGALLIGRGTSLYGQASYMSAFNGGDAWTGNLGLRMQW